MSEIIPIEKYDFKSVRRNGSMVTEYYAVAGKTRYPMPAAFAEMYTENYLAIKKVSALEMSEVLGEDLSSEYYIPIFTGGN